MNLAVIEVMGKWLCKCGCGQESSRPERVRYDRGFVEGIGLYLPGHRGINPNRAKRKCSTCQAIKGRSEFNKNSAMKDGIANECKVCMGKRVAEWQRTVKRFAQYGITRCDFDQMWNDQSGLCAICREDPIEHIDHCHNSGRVRGLLCASCNMGLGQFKDDAMRLQAAFVYLARG